jgi:hypothetical protein
MDPERIDKALARLDAATARAESAARAVAENPTVRADEHSGLQQRHTRLKDSVVQSLRQLDEILAELPQ